MFVAVYSAEILSHEIGTLKCSNIMSEVSITVEICTGLGALFLSSHMRKYIMVITVSSVKLGIAQEKYYKREENMDFVLPTLYTFCVRKLRPYVLQIVY